jgi:hypothetical protein
MKNRYWFPAMPVFPDNYAPEPAELPVQTFSGTYELPVIPFVGVCQQHCPGTGASSRLCYGLSFNNVVKGNHGTDFCTDGIVVYIA